MPRSLFERLQALEKSVGRQKPSPPVDPEPLRPELFSQDDAAVSAATLEDLTLQRLRSECDDLESKDLQLIQNDLGSLGFRRVRGDAGGDYWLRELRFDLLSMHGGRRFADVLNCELAIVAKAVKLPDVPRHLRFYDTETTGLGTGAGTFPFLHSIGEVEQDEFVVYQYFLEEYSAEQDMLNAVLRHFLVPDAAVVTFNGKSFDWPLLQSRLVMHRLSLLEPPDHIDLLYPSRRFWRKALGRVSLANLEQHVLGMTRVDDLPGKEAPGRYFAFVEEKDPGLIEPVFEHNATDVCTLVTLLCVLADKLSEKQTPSGVEDFLALARWYDEWQEHTQADRCYVAAARCPDADWRALWLHSLRLKRRGDWEEAAKVWREMFNRFPWTIQPAVELAKLAEHRKRELAEAQDWTQKALERSLVFARLPVSTGASETQTALHSEIRFALQHRLSRIRDKIQKAAAKADSQ
ncbi:ribonuclease H-like domain-containing protein [Alicyclobacillus tolerans]|uniref:ribonuclease H-like domain-containing protein n=1 Tax=Alicyclobacillus tolerans TaxID=90970 RepID=UPI001F1AE9CB|nr:ribonuclease H-like domain-containing protein [Alicyclobacillus tolerans]MCF8563873.1 ribonuclease H-like domain-containing protein [Alicyclobacillus tolerans]